MNLQAKFPFTHVKFKVFNFQIYIHYTSIVETFSALNFCPEHEIIMLRWNAGNLQPYCGFWCSRWLLPKWCLFVFLHCLVLVSSEFQRVILPPSSGWLNLPQINPQYVTCSDYRKIYYTKLRRSTPLWIVYPPEAQDKRKVRRTVLCAVEFRWTSGTHKK
jgi:hypothetical protein